MDQQLILDRYRPLAELGEGGYATVVLAWDTRMQRRVAIKRLPLPLDARGSVLDDPPGLAEARTAAMLNHPAIVTVYDFETDADEAFLIMEYVDGSSLEDLLDNVRGPLDLDEAAAVIEAVTAALEFAHDNGVLHLDIKPGNVLVTRDGRVKVADFGMAALSSAMGHGPSGGGTLGYMPLEQLGGQRVSEATDQWALAVLAYECLTGANPFDAETFESAIVKIETLDPPAPSEYEPTLPRAIDDILLAGTGPRPADRYPSIGLFADTLLPHLGDIAEGRVALGELVVSYAEIEPEAAEDPDWEHVGLWDRLQGGRAGGVLLRGVAAVESGWLAWAGLAALPLERLPVLVTAAVVAIVGALAPSLGTGLGLIAFSAGLFAHGLWLLASAFTLGAVAWWWLVARRNAGAAVLPLAAPVLAVARMPFAMPLLAGFVLPPLEASAAGLVGGALTLLASAASGTPAPYASVDPLLFADPTRALAAGAHVSAAFASPSTWIALLGWPLAALVMSLFARRATRLSAVIGALLGTVALYGSYTLAERAKQFFPQPTQWIGSAFIISLAASLILVLLVAALGAPLRAEEDVPRFRSYEYDDDDDALEETGRT